MGDRRILTTAYHSGGFEQWSSGEYSSDGPPPLEFEPILTGALTHAHGVQNIEARIYEETLGDLQIINLDNSINNPLIGYDWKGYSIWIYVVDSNMSFGHAELLYKGINRGIKSATREKINFTIEPYSTLLNKKKIQKNFISSADGSIDGMPIPLNFGKVYGVEGVVISESYTEYAFWNRRTVTYRLHDGENGGELQKVNKVYSGGLHILTETSPTTLSEAIRFGLINGVIDKAAGIVSITQDIYKTDNYSIFYHIYDNQTGHLPPSYAQDYVYSNNATSRLLIRNAEGSLLSVVMILKSGSVPANNDTFVPVINGSVMSESYTEYAFWNRRTVTYSLSEYIINNQLLKIEKVYSGGFHILSEDNSGNLVKSVQFGLFSQLIDKANGTVSITQDIYKTSDYDIFFHAYDSQTGTTVPDYADDYTYSNGAKTRLLLRSEGANSCRRTICR